jgi:hypothetical protein
MSRFPNEHHLASWAGMCPGQRESAGKKHSAATRPGSKWLRGTLAECSKAVVRSKGTYLSARYHRIKSRRGHAKATVATGHTSSPPPTTSSTKASPTTNSETTSSTAATSKPPTATANASSNNSNTSATKSPPNPSPTPPDPTDPSTQEIIFDSEGDGRQTPARTPKQGSRSARQKTSVSPAAQPAHRRRSSPRPNRAGVARSHQSRARCSGLRRPPCQGPRIPEAGLPAPRGPQTSLARSAGLSSSWPAGMRRRLRS